MILLAIPLILLAATLVYYYRQNKKLLHELHKERLRRIAWERAVGLPFWDDQETENALWVRASLNRDPLASDVLATLYFEEDEEFFKQG